MNVQDTKQPLTLERINELKKQYLTSLRPIDSPNGGAIFKLSLDCDYTGLVNTISSLISVSQSAIEGMNEFELPYCDAYDITKTLEIAKSLLPYSEIEFLDEIRGKS